MAKPEWGLKRTCLSCSTRFYDMTKVPIVCPSCEAVFDPEAVLRPRRSRAPVEAPKPVPAKVKAPEDDDSDDDDLKIEGADDVADLDDDDDDDALEDTSDLGEDDEDVPKPPAKDDT